MANGKIIVVGASAGGVKAILGFIGDLPKGLNAAVFIVWHMSADAVGVLPAMINKLNGLSASTAVDGEAIVNGRIYVAPPDKHLLIEDGLVQVAAGPKENRFRPAIDPLFRSAAYTYGPRVIGVILSGGLDDGTSGLWLIRQRGGIAVVQEPTDATITSMPMSAISQVKIDFCVPVSKMAELLVTLTLQNRDSMPDTDYADEENLAREVAIAGLRDVHRTAVINFGEPTFFACPECHGVLSAITEGSRTRYRCHTGHAYSGDSLLVSLNEGVEASLWNVIRGAEERVALLHHLSEVTGEARLSAASESYYQQAEKEIERIKRLRNEIALGNK